MRALTGDALGGQGGDAHRLLPRPLRLAIRFMRRLATGSVTFPRHTGAVATAAFLAVTGFYGAWVGGHMPALLAATSTRAGLSVDAIRITGYSRTTKDEVLAALDFDTTASIIGVDVQAARQKLMALPWVTSVSVAKAYPGSVSVDIVEKKAAAVKITL